MRQSSAQKIEESGKREVQRGPKHEQIIVAAIDVFARTNFEKATTALIAREAGVAEGTLYKYFPSKKELFLACFRYVEDELLARYRSIYEETKDDRPVEYIRRVALSYHEFVRENPSMRKFLAFALNSIFDEDFRRELEGFMNLNVQATQRMIERAMERGELKRGLDPRNAAWIFVGGYFTLILMAEIGAPEAEDPRFVEHLISAVLE